MIPTTPSPSRSSGQPTHGPHTPSNCRKSVIPTTQVAVEIGGTDEFHRRPDGLSGEGGHCAGTEHAELGRRRRRRGVGVEPEVVQRAPAKRVGRRGPHACTGADGRAPRCVIDRHGIGIRRVELLVMAGDGVRLEVGHGRRRRDGNADRADLPVHVDVQQRVLVVPGGLVELGRLGGQHAPAVGRDELLDGNLLGDDRLRRACPGVESEADVRIGLPTSSCRTSSSRPTSR